MRQLLQEILFSPETILELERVLHDPEMGIAPVILQSLEDLPLAIEKLITRCDQRLAWLGSLTDAQYLVHHLREGGQEYPSRWPEILNRISLNVLTEVATTQIAI
ncbi:MAG: hypothetical protein ACOX6V_02255 [Patescibacteria group bacterium]